MIDLGFSGIDPDLIDKYFATLAAIGFVAVFAGAANTPLACTVMAIELFGPEIAREGIARFTAGLAAVKR